METMMKGSRAPVILFKHLPGDSTWELRRGNFRLGASPKCITIRKRRFQCFDSSVLPEPIYFATCDQEQSGRVCTTPLFGSPLVLYFVAMIRSGAIPCSTQASSAESMLWKRSPFGVPP